MKLGGRKAKINPVASSEYPVKAERPHNSRMSKKCLDDAEIKRLPTWQDALNRFLKELGELNEINSCCSLL